MAQMIGGLRALLDLDTGAFNTKIAGAANKLDSSKAKMNRSLAGIQGGFNKLNSGVGRMTRSVFSLNGALGALLGGGSLIALTRGAINSGDAIGKLADRSGVGVEAIQELTHAANLAGLETTNLENGLRYLSRQLGQTLAKGDTSFLGVALKDELGNIKTADKALEDLADKIAAIEDPVIKATVAGKAFGERYGSQMLPLMKNGARGIREAREEARKLGLVIGEETVRKTETLKDQMGTLGDVIKTNFQAGLLDGILQDSRDLSDIYSDPAFAENIRDIGMALGEAFKYLVDNADTILSIGALFGGGALLKGATGFAAKHPLLAGGAIGYGAYKAAPESGDYGGFNYAKTGLPPAGIKESVKESVDTLDTWVTKSKEMGFVTEASITKPANDAAGAIDLLNDKTAKGSKAADEKKKKEQEAARVYDQTRTAAEQYAAAVEQLNGLLDQGYLDQDTFNRAVAQAKENLDSADESAKKAREAAHELGLTFTSAFEDAIVSGNKLRDVLQGVAQDVFRLFIRKQVTEPASDALDKLFSGSGIVDSVFNSIFGGGQQVYTSPIGPTLSGAPLGRAAGGPVSAGELYQVNEHRRAEYFMPNVSGQIIPLAADGGGGGNTYVINAPGADQSTIRRLEQMILSAAGPGVIEHRVADAQRRGAL